MSTVYEYEVVLNVASTKTRAQRQISRTEWAYSVRDAIDQAIYGNKLGPDEEYTGIDKIGPPLAAILAAPREIAKAVDLAATELLSRRLSPNKA